MSILFLVGFAALGMSQPAHAVNCMELNQLWATKYYDDLKASWPLETFGCHSTFAKIAKGVYDLDNTTFGPNTNGDYFSFYSWTMAQIKRTDYEDKDKKREWAIAQASQDGVMTLFQGFA